MTDHKTMYECAVEFVRNLIHEANEQGEKIRRLEAEIRELRAQAEELRFNPNHDPENGRFTSDESGGKGVDFSGKSGIMKIEKVDNVYKEFNAGEEVNKYFGGSGGILDRQNSVEKQWLKSLTSEEKSATSEYCADGYYDINTYL